MDRVLKTAYYRFRLGHGPLDSLLQREGLEKLLQSLVTFFDGYIGSELILENLDVVAGMDGLSILPVTKHTFLQVQTTLKTLHTSFSSLEAVGLIHLGQLVWSGTHLPTDAVRFLTSLSRGFSNPVKKPVITFMYE